MSGEIFVCHGGRFLLHLLVAAVGAKLSRIWLLFLAESTVLVISRSLIVSSFSFYSLEVSVFLKFGVLHLYMIQARWDLVRCPSSLLFITLFSCGSGGKCFP